MASSLYFDHAVILVTDLDAAIEDYRRLGFNAFFGGKHAGGKTHNGLIVFKDGSYLELLAPTSPDLIKQVNPSDRTNFLFMFTWGEGFGGYALHTDSLKAQVEAMSAHGLDMRMRPPGGRARPADAPARTTKNSAGKAL